MNNNQITVSYKNLKNDNRPKPTVSYKILNCTLRRSTTSIYPLDKYTLPGYCLRMATANPGREIEIQESPAATVHKSNKSIEK